MEFYEKAAALVGHAETDDQRARYLANAATAYALSGDVTRGTQYIERALQMKRRIAASSSLALTLINASDIARQSSRTVAARGYATEAVAIAGLCGDDVVRAAATVALGKLACETGAQGEGAAKLTEARAVFVEHNVGPELADVDRALSGCVPP